MPGSAWKQAEALSSGVLVVYCPGFGRGWGKEVRGVVSRDRDLYRLFSRAFTQAWKEDDQTSSGIRGLFMRMRRR
jgi:hypothetical protein